jgi:hypothetical protein
MASAAWSIGNSQIAGPIAPSITGISANIKSCPCATGVGGSANGKGEEHDSKKNPFFHDVPLSSPSRVSGIPIQLPRYH